MLPQLEQAQKDAENGAKEPEEIQRLILSIQKEKENLKRYTNLENLRREIENVSKQIEKLAIDSIALQNRQKEKKTVLEQKQKEYQTTDSAEKEKAETDFRKEKIDTLYACLLYTSELMLPGGKGINVSTVLMNLGIENTALGFTAGFVGKEIIRRLHEMGVKSEFIQISEGVSRINLKLKSIDGTEINGAGPVISKDKVEEPVSYTHLDVYKRQTEEY